MVDLTSGLSPDRERVATTQPDVPFWADNMMFALYDPAADVAMMFHLGSRPDDWSMWHDQAYVVLPPSLFPEGGGVAWMWAYHRTAPERKPAGANVAFACIEPFTRWQVTFDGYMLMTPNAEMTTGLAREGHHQKVMVDLEVEMLTPAWDATAGAGQPTARGTWESQGWADHHYQQLYKATGSLVVGSDEVAIAAYGWRDHSQGSRGGAPRDGIAPWGGHTTAAAVYPENGRAWSYSRYWSPGGEVSFDAGYVVDQGTLHHARIVQAPRLNELVLAGEELPVALAWNGGTLETTMTTRRTLWMAMRLHQVVGIDMEGPGMMYPINHGQTSPWDGEAGVFYLERSDMLNFLADRLHRDGETLA
jgi:hypothetical protein